MPLTMTTRWSAERESLSLELQTSWPPFTDSEEQTPLSETPFSIEIQLAISLAISSITRSIYSPKSKESARSRGEKYRKWGEFEGNYREKLKAWRWMEMEEEQRVGWDCGEMSRRKKDKTWKRIKLIETRAKRFQFFIQRPIHFFLFSFLLSTCIFREGKNINKSLPNNVCIRKPKYL